MADIRMPATHWAGRILILALLAALVFGLVRFGLVRTAVDWATDRITAATTELWKPLTEPAG